MSLVGGITSNNPNRSGHLGGIDSGNVNPLYNEQHFGGVERRFLKESFFRKFLKIRPVRGTDTLTNPRMGHVPLQKLQRSIRAGDHSPTYDSISIKVDTVILARANEWTLEDYQASYNFRAEIADEQGKEIGKFFDMCCIAQAVKGAQVTTVWPDGSLHGGWEGLTPTNILRSAPEGHLGGTCIVFGAAGDEEDPILAEQALRSAATAVLKKDVDLEGMVWLTGWDFYNTLSENDKLINTDYNRSNQNGDYSLGTVNMVRGVMLHPNNRMPSEVHVRGTNDHFLSNASNQWSYNNSANDVKCVAVLISPKALLGGETIPVQTKIFWDDIEKQWFIDAWTSFAVTPNRAEVAAAIFKSGVA